MQSQNKMLQSNTILYENECCCIYLNVSIHTESSSSGIRTCSRAGTELLLSIKGFSFNNNNNNNNPETNYVPWE